MLIFLVCRGAVAQLGERLNGIQEVRGSIPLSSTIKFLTQPSLRGLRFLFAVSRPYAMLFAFNRYCMVFFP